MNLDEVKEKLYDLAKMFFEGATVIWVEQINTKPKVPYVTLKCNSIGRTSFPVVNDDNNSRIYHENTILEINLYTKGMPVTVGEEVLGNYANTATSDLLEFANFLESDEITDIIAGYGMDIALMPPVRDLTGLQNDVNYRYRAMAEFTVSFAQESNGPYGIGGMPFVPNSSGGGNNNMTEAETDVIETIEIEEGGSNDEK